MLIRLKEEYHFFSARNMVLILARPPGDSSADEAVIRRSGGDKPRRYIDEKLFPMSSTYLPVSA